MRDERFRGNPVLSVLLTLLLGPLAVVGYGLAAVSIIGVVTGWSPSFLSGETPLDSLYGGGTATFVRFLGFVAGALVGTLASGVVVWGFTGEFKAPGLD